MNWYRVHYTRLSTRDDMKKIKIKRKIQNIPPWTEYKDRSALIVKFSTVFIFRPIMVLRAWYGNTRTRTNTRGFTDTKLRKWDEKTTNTIILLYCPPCTTDGCTESLRAQTKGFSSAYLLLGWVGLRIHVCSTSSPRVCWLQILEHADQIGLSFALSIVAHIDNWPN